MYTIEFDTGTVLLAAKLLIGHFYMETTLSQPWTWNVLHFAPLGTQVNGVFKEPSNKVVCPMVLYKRVFFSPWGSLCLYKWRQPSLGILALLEGQENPHHLFYLNTDCRKYILENTTWSCNSSNLLVFEIQSWNLLRKNLAGFKCLLQYQNFFNRTGIQLALTLKRFTEA